MRWIFLLFLMLLPMPVHALDEPAELIACEAKARYSLPLPLQESFKRIDGNYFGLVAEVTFSTVAQAFDLAICGYKDGPDGRRFVDDPSISDGPLQECIGKADRMIKAKIATEEDRAGLRRSCQKDFDRFASDYRLMLSQFRTPYPLPAGGP